MRRRAILALPLLAPLRMPVMNELKDRGVEDILIAVVGDLS
jgi:hypothetical protein